MDNDRFIEFAVFALKTLLKEGEKWREMKVSIQKIPMEFGDESIINLGITLEVNEPNGHLVTDLTVTEYLMVDQEPKDIAGAVRQLRRAIEKKLAGK